MRIGIVGGGIGGLAAAIALHRAGCDVTVFEQSKQFQRVGADINLTFWMLGGVVTLLIGYLSDRADLSHCLSRKWMLVAVAS